MRTQAVILSEQAKAGIVIQTPHLRTRGGLTQIVLPASILSECPHDDLLLSRRTFSYLGLPSADANIKSFVDLTNKVDKFTPHPLIYSTYDCAAIAFIGNSRYVGQFISPATRAPMTILYVRSSKQKKKKKINSFSFSPRPLNRNNKLRN